MTPSNNTNC